jgi:GMP synthase PP-ATPase subunit
MNTNEAAEIISHTAKKESFQPTNESWQAVNDLALGTRVKAAIESYCKPDIKPVVTAKSGIVNIRVITSNIRKTGATNPMTEDYFREKMEQEISKEISSAISDIPDIKKVIYDINPPSYI